MDGMVVVAPRKIKVRELSQVLVEKRYAGFGPGSYDEDDCPLETCHVFVVVIDGIKRVFRGRVHADGDFVHRGSPSDLVGIVLIDESTKQQVFPVVG